MTVTELIAALEQYAGDLCVFGETDYGIAPVKSVTEEVLNRTVEHIIVLDVDYMF